MDQYPEPTNNPNCKYKYIEVTVEHLKVITEDTTVAKENDETITLSIDRQFGDEQELFDNGLVRPEINTYTDIYDTLHNIIEIILERCNQHDTNPTEIKTGLYYKENEQDNWTHYDENKQYASYVHKIEQLTDNEFIEWVQDYKSNRGLAVRQLRNKIIENVNMNHHGWQAAQKLSTVHLTKMAQQQRKEQRQNDPGMYVKFLLERNGVNGRTAASIASQLKDKQLLTDEVTDNVLDK